MPAHPTIQPKHFKSVAKVMDTNPNTVKVFLNDFYFWLSTDRADTLEEACVLQDDMIETLNISPKGLSPV